MEGSNGKKNKCEFPKAQKYLDRIRQAEQHVDWLKERADNLRMLLTDTSVHYTDMPHSDSPDLQIHETLHAEIDELEREVQEAELEAAEIKLEVGRTVCKLSNPVIQKALLYYYLDGKHWTDVAEKIQFSIAQTYRFRNAGLAELEKMLQTVA